MQFKNITSRLKLNLTKKSKKYIYILVLILSYLVFNFFLNNVNNLNTSKNISIKDSENINNSEEDFCERFVKDGKYYKIWSDTDPKINKTHIYCGEINSSNKASGLHFLKGGNSNSTARFVKINKSNSKGVYTATIEILDIKNNVYKSKFSSIFPNNLSIEEVNEIIVNAWNNKTYYKNSKFRGPSGLGFEIEGYTYKNTDNINTAYPIYKK